MQVVNGDLELKNNLFFGRPNYIRLNKADKKYEFVIDETNKILEIGSTGLTIDGDLTVDGIIAIEDIITNTLVSTTGTITNLNSTNISTTSISTNQLNLTGNLTGDFDIVANSIQITSPSIFMMTLQ